MYRNVFNRLVFLLAAILFTNTLWAQGNNLIYISGKVTDKETGKRSTGVSVQIKGTIAGTITSDSGTLLSGQKINSLSLLYLLPLDFLRRNIR